MSQKESSRVVDPERGSSSESNTSERFKPSADDEASQSLWKTYLDQARNYDTAFLEGWRADMEGIVIFSTLYSAILTALLIESYKRLQEDPADATLATLVQISKQMALLSNGTVFTYESRPAFKIDTASTVCNTFWFFSLALAITCALLAIFVQQWVRDFLYKTTVQPSPIAQARILAFSYFGLQRFRMHHFVEFITTLLHISLFFFFAGLVAFLHPINLFLTYLMAGISGFFFLVYISLSCIPLVYLDAPYRTPVSDLIWRLGNGRYGFFTRHHKLPENLGLTEAMVEASFKDYQARDHQCMKFTVRSLNSNADLLPMLKAIPEAIQSSTDIRTPILNLITPILVSKDPNENIISRISTFITVSGQSADPERQKIGMETCLKALWSLACLVIENSKGERHSSPSMTPDSAVVWFDRALLTSLRLVRYDLPSMPHVTSALALVRTSRLQSLKSCIDLIADCLSQAAGTPTSAHSKQSALARARDIFQELPNDIHWKSESFKDHFSKLEDTLNLSVAPNSPRDRVEGLVERAKEYVFQLQRPSRWKAALISVLGEFLSEATKAHETPFEMSLTHDIITNSISQVDVLQQTDEVADEVEDDEAEASLLLQDISTKPSDVPEELFRLVFRLAFSTPHALKSQKCRSVVVGYLHNKILDQQNHDARSVDISWDTYNFVGECILQELHASDSPNSPACVSLIRTIYYSMGLHTSFEVPKRLGDFARKVFHLVSQKTVPPQLTHDHWWNSRKVYTEWVLCKEILNELDKVEDSSGNVTSLTQVRDHIRTLGQRVSTAFHVPENPIPNINTMTADDHKKWVEEIRTCVMSINLSIISNFILINAKDTDGAFLGDWKGMQHWLVDYSGHIDNDAQLQFARSVRDLVINGHPWNQPKESPAFQVFHEWIWQLSTQKWCWITHVESAKVLQEVIECHKNDPKFGGWIWREEALFIQCKKVILEAGQDTGYE